MQGDANEVVEVRIDEAIQTASGWKNSGRYFVLGSDCPLFASWGDVGKEAIARRCMSMNAEMFEQAVQIINEVAASSLPIGQA